MPKPKPATVQTTRTCYCCGLDIDEVGPLNAEAYCGDCYADIRADEDLCEREGWPDRDY